MGLKQTILNIYFLLPESVKDTVWLKYLQVIKKEQYVRYNIMNVRDGILGGDIVFCPEKEKTYTYSKLPMYFDDADEKKKEVELPNRYVARLFDVVIHGTCSFVLSGTQCLDDIQNMYSPIQCIRCEEIVKNTKKHIWIRKWTKTEKIKRGISLVGMGSDNLYHLTVEIVSRLLWIERLNLYKEYPILLDERVQKIPQYSQLINVVNTLGRNVIEIKPKVNYEVEELVYASPNVWIPFNVKKNFVCTSSFFVFSRKSLLMLKNTVLRNEICEEPFRKIYVSRKKLTNQRVENEEQIEEMFKKRGFQVVYPEELDYVKQVRIFNEAKYVAGNSGAAMTNLIFCNEGSTYITFVDETNEMYLYPTIAKLLHLNCHLLPLEIIKRESSLVNSHFKVDIGVCEKYLNMFEE